jgi:hypothetical protein
LETVTHRANLRSAFPKQTELAKRQAQLESQQSSLAQHIDTVLEQFDSSLDDFKAVREEIRQNASKKSLQEVVDQCKGLQLGLAQLQDDHSAHKSADQMPRMGRSRKKIITTFVPFVCSFHFFCKEGGGFFLYIITQ